VSVTAAIYFGYQIGFSDGYDPISQLHFMTSIIFSIAGISGMEVLKKHKTF
jgi:hypothetical protein